MATILDFANTPALSDFRLGIHRKTKEYNMLYIFAKFGSFGRICPKISLTAPTNTAVQSQNTVYAYFKVSKYCFLALQSSIVVLLPARFMAYAKFLLNITNVLNVLHFVCQYFISF